GAALVRYRTLRAANNIGWFTYFDVKWTVNKSACQDVAKDTGIPYRAGCDPAFSRPEQPLRPRVYDPRKASRTRPPEDA
ncbi:MAG TPA: hypothetical protein VHZ32_04780, partial [Rhizomicrobium sp.]|nr:hypothetical protein [Rhizomicrobium sp.]